MSRHYNYYQPQPFPSFFTLRALSPHASEIHLVGGTDLGADRDDHVMTELEALVNARFWTIESGHAGHSEVTRLGELGRFRSRVRRHRVWRGLRVTVDDWFQKAIARLGHPHLHNMLARWVKALHPNIDVVWREP